ncbi:uncharacterized protein [Nicotiana tomentosiformis]|uniref:uncharacterized protein n=1 Tax=Nicotiana tomentosiformis TaxID=4098 RepID=UPI00388C965F
MALFEDLYGRRCCSPIGRFEPGKAKLYGTDLVKDALEKVKLIQEGLRTAQSKQIRKRVNYHLSLSGVHPVFHVSILRKYNADLSHVLDFSTAQLDKSLGYEEELVAIVDKHVHQLRSKRISIMEVMKPIDIISKRLYSLGVFGITR